MGCEAIVNTIQKSPTKSPPQCRLFSTSLIVLVAEFPDGMGQRDGAFFGASVLAGRYLHTLFREPLSRAE
jgi:hypothetical protein